MGTPVVAKVWYIRKSGLVATLKRLLLTSPWDTVAIEIDNVFYTAERETGCVSMDRYLFEKRYPHRTFSGIRLNKPVAAIETLKQGIGTPTTAAAYLPRPWRESWLDRPEWTSTEYVATALMAAGHYMPTRRSRLVPREFWNYVPKFVAHKRVQ